MKILPKNRVLRIIVYVVLCVVAALGITLAVFWAGEWTPEPMEVMYDEGSSGDSIPTKLKIVSWNIGYAGLGSDMDFFYDGGNSVQTSKERTETNMHKIIEFLQQNRDADFILLQEVDFPSKRSYYLNEYDSLRAALPEFMGWWGLNYVSQYVPIPLTNPIGSVKAGVVILTRHQPQQVVRYSYPSKFPFPVSIFNLKRCLLEASFAIVGSDQTFYLGNTHNTAYDRGGMRSKEMEFLKNFLFGKRFSFTAGDWNSNPPFYVASKAERDDKYFPIESVSSTALGLGQSFLYDGTTPSARYGYQPYDSATTTRTIIDFAAFGDGVSPFDVQTIDLEFENSDHNPVIYYIAIKP